MTIQDFLDHLELSEELGALEVITEHQIQDLYHKARTNPKDILYNCILNVEQDTEYLENILRSGNQAKIQEVAKLLLDCSSFSVICDPHHKHYNELVRCEAKAELDIREELSAFFYTNMIDSLMQELKNNHDIGEYYELGGDGVEWVAKVNYDKFLESYQAATPQSNSIEHYDNVLNFEALTAGRTRTSHRFYSDSEASLLHLKKKESHKVS